MANALNVDATLLEPLRQVGDPLADAAIAEAVSLGADGNRLLDNAIRKGIDVDTPPAMRRLIEDAQLPGWADRASLKRGSEAYLAIGSNWIGLALGPGSLTHTYSSPSIARVLVKTANLTKMARRRIMETGAWNIATALPDGLLPGNDGYLQHMQVRLLHARVRYGLNRKGWDVASHGVPINQFEMIRTWLDFTYVPFGALSKLGIDFSEAEMSDLYHLWQVSGHILGIDDGVIRTVNDQQSAKALLDTIHRMEGPPNDDSRRLTIAMLDGMGELLAPGLGVPASVARNLSAATLRRLHGREMAEQLGVSWNWTALALPAIAMMNRIRRAQERRNPERRKKTIAAAILTHETRGDLFSGPTTYERAATEDAALGPPATRNA